MPSTGRLYPDWRDRLFFIAKKVNKKAMPDNPFQVSGKQPPLSSKKHVSI